MTPQELRHQAQRVLAIGDFVTRFIPGGIDERVMEYLNEGVSMASDKFLGMLIEDVFSGGPFMASPEEAEFASAHQIEDPAVVSLLVRMARGFDEIVV